MYAYNNTKHSNTGWRPVEVFLGQAARIVWPKRKKVGSHQAFNVGDQVLRKVEQSNKMAPKYDPGYVVEQVSATGQTYVIRRERVRPGQTSLFKAHHNQLRKGKEGCSEAETQAGKMSPAVKTLIVLGRYTRRVPAPEADKKQITSERKAKRISREQSEKGSQGKKLNMRDQEEDDQQISSTCPNDREQKESGIGSRIESEGTTRTNGTARWLESADMQPQCK